MKWYKFTPDIIPNGDIWIMSFCENFIVKATPLRLEIGRNGFKSLLCYKYPQDQEINLHIDQKWCYVEELL